MYRPHFALTHHPFSNEVEPEDLFPAVAAKELEVRLNHLLEMRGIGLVTGDSGSGKTCGTRRVLAQLHASLYRVFAAGAGDRPDVPPPPLHRSAGSWWGP